MNAVNRKAVDAAQAAVKDLIVTPAGLVEYQSRGRCLVIGATEAAEFAPRLSDVSLQVQVLLTEGPDDPGLPVIPVAGRAIRVTGYLGNFQVSLGEEGKANHEIIEADLVLDLQKDPVLKMPAKPPGYFVADINDEQSLAAAVLTLSEMKGTFEKPGFFEYDASICAHGRSGVAGCSLCIDSCPTDAIISLGEKIEVNPNLCQGGGICATACPTGAIRYAYPRCEDIQERIRLLLQTYHEQGGMESVIAFVAEVNAAALPATPDNALIVTVEELASIGLDVWMFALAHGAGRVLLVNDDTIPETVLSFLDEELETAKALLRGLGYPPDVIKLTDLEHFALHCESSMPEIAVAQFASMPQKRQAAIWSVDHLFTQATDVQAVFSLPENAPFGRVHVNAGACTLCMSCTSACPANAINAGVEEPRLLFHEENCVQCGICASTCPENAITLEPRWVANPEERRQAVILHEEQPFCCISCGKPFATQSGINTILAKLSGHYMFQTDRAIRRLKMCEDCRVADVVQDEEMMGSGRFNPH